MTIRVTALALAHGIGSLSSNPYLLREQSKSVGATLNLYLGRGFLLCTTPNVNKTLIIKKK